MANSIFSTNKEARFQQKTDDIVVSPRTYNLIIGGVVVYGLLVNFLICTQFQYTFLSMNPIALIIGYIICLFAGTIIVSRSNNPFISFLGYNLVVIPLGAVLSVCLVGYSPAIIFQACGLTASIVAIMLCLGALFPQIFLSMGRGLFVSLIILIIAGIFCSITNIGLTLYSYAGAAIFSLYIAYDWVRANQYVMTLDNAVDSACDIYIDIINLFLHVLSILGRRND